MKRNLFLWLALLAALVAACSPESPSFGPPEGVATAALLPQLVFPAGAEFLGGGGGGGGGRGGPAGGEQQADFISQLELEVVHNFFAAQLVASGWQEVNREGGDGQMVSYWELEDEAGTTWAARVEVKMNTEQAPYEYGIEVKLVLPQGGGD